MGRGGFALLLVLVALPAHAAEDCRCPDRTPATELGPLQHPELTESSGLAVSRSNPGVLWTHNDSGDGPRLFAATHDGRHLGIYTLDGASAVDWEDLALGPCPAGECLFVADVGDNDVVRGDLVLYRVPEPAVDAAGPPQSATLAGVEAFPLAYPAGEAADAETVLVDPTSGAVYLVTKVLSGKSRLYHAPLGAPGEPVLLERLAEATIGRIAVLEQATTGGAFAPDGRRFVVRTYPQLHEFYIPDGGDIATAFAGEPITSGVDERQGEAVAYAPDGVTLWTTSEGAAEPLRAYGCEVVVASDCSAVEPPPADADELASDASDLVPDADSSDVRPSDGSDAGPPPDEDAGDGGDCCSTVRAAGTKRGARAPFLALLAALGLAGLIRRRQRPR